MKKPKHKRAKKAVTALKEFLIRHMKIDDPKNLLIGTELNKKIWEHGIKNPPTKLKVTAIKDEKGIVRVELEGVKFVDRKKEKKEEKPETAIDRMKGMIGQKESRAAKSKQAKEDMQKKEDEVKDALAGKEENNKKEPDPENPAENKPGSQPEEKKEEKKYSMRN